MNKKINILQMTLTKRMGGIEVLQKSIFQTLNKECYDVYFIVNGDKGAFEEDLSDAGGHIVHLSDMHSLWSTIWKLHKLLKHTHFDVAHIHKCSCANVLPFVLCRLHHVPIVIAHAHATHSFKGKAGFILHMLGRPIVRRMSTHHIGCSQEACEWLFGKAYIKKHAVSIMHNGIACDVFHYDSELRRQKRKELHVEDHLVIGHVGRFQEAKNHTFLLDIFACILQKQPKAKLMLVGDGEYMQRIQDKVHASALNHAVIFLKECYPVVPYYQAMDLFLLPSLYEAFPITLLEAYASGLPCLLSEELDLQNSLPALSCISLKEKKEVWAEEALSLMHRKRKDQSDVVRQLGYDIQQSVSELEKLYRKGR